jgi:hypothetical protein
MSRTKQIISHFPDFYGSGESENLFYQYIGVFASMLDDAEEDLLRVMRTHWVNTADNEGSKGFDATEKGDLDKILALYLESLGGTALIKQGKRRSGEEGKADDALYRNRILGLIQVLKNGASTRAGIIDIVAANLGIVSDLPYASGAHDSIDIIEFLPETSSSAELMLIRLYENIPVNNLSALPGIAEFRLEFLPSLPLPLIDPKITNPLTGDSVQYIGTVTPGDILYFLSDGTGLYRGQPFQPVGGLVLPPGPSNLRLEANVGLPLGIFDNALFDYSQFEKPTVRALGVFDAVQFDNSIFTYDTDVAKLEIRYKRLFPGSFMVSIPWDIPGFSVNISVTAYTLERLAVFGLPQPIIDALSSLVTHAPFETLEAFFMALGPLVETQTGVIEINRQNISQLNLFGVPAVLVARAITLIDSVSGIATYPNLPALFTALAPLKEGEKKALYGALGTLLKAGSPLEIVLRECLFADKFARFNISPRGQIKSIVERVKAAGVYAVIAFKKHFFEDQQLAEQLGLVWKPTAYDQEMTESNFDITSAQTSGEQQEMSDFFSASGVFDYTRFDTLNTFA